MRIRVDEITLFGEEKARAGVERTSVIRRAIPLAYCLSFYSIERRTAGLTNKQKDKLDSRVCGV